MAQTAQININVNSKSAQESVDKLSKSISGAGGTAASLRAELRQVTVELQQLEPGSKRFQELSARAGQLRDQIQDTNAVINATAGNVTENFGKALGSAVQIGVAGFQGLMAVQTLFGTENEELNKTLLKMTALLNFSQAISSLGGLKDSFTQIKAGLTPILTSLGLIATEQTAVATSTAAADAALVGEAVAAEGATVATGGLAVALNSIPFVAIATAVGLLVAGLIAYSASSDEAAKKEKEAAKQRKILEERTKALEKAQDEERQKVAESSVEYFNLIQKLRDTNAGSKERQRLINQINGQYGTTLKNIKDENAFQSQLNLSVKEYIALQVLRVRQESKKKEEEKAIKNLVAAQDNLTKFAREYGGTIDKNGKLQTKWTEKQISDYDLATYGVSTFRDTQVKLNMELDDANKKAQAYAITNNKLQEEIDKLNIKFPKTVEGYKETTISTKDATDANEKYADLLDEVKNKLEREIAVQQTTEKLRQDRLTGIDKEINSIEKLYGDERQSIIDRAIQRELTLLDERFKKEGKSEADYLKASEEIRNNYGKYLLDSEAELLQSLDAYRQQDIEETQKAYTAKEQIVLETTKNIQTQTQMLQLQFEKNEAIRIIEESKKTEEEKNQAKLEVRKKYAQQEIDLLNKNLDEQKKLIELQLQEILKDEDKTAAEKEQATEDANQKIIKATQDTADKINEINAGVKAPIDEDKLEKSLEKINEYVEAVTTAFNALANTITLINDTRFAEEERQINGRYEFEKQALDNQLAEGIIAREQYDNSIKELDQQREQEALQLKKKEFDANKRLNMANAIINGAQGVLQALASSAPPINFILAGIVAAASAVQFGVISSQEFTAAGGGIVPGIGSGMVDTVPARLAPGETVINAQSSQMYPELLNSINMAGGGISLKPDLPATNRVDADVKFFGDNKSDKPIRAYVVETDVSDTQKRINRIKQSSEF
jgi:hypothetical protein